MCGFLWMCECGCLSVCLFRCVCVCTFVCLGLLVNVCVGVFRMSECLVVRSAHVGIKCRFLITSLNKLNFDLKKSQIIFIADSGRWLGRWSGC